MIERLPLSIIIVSWNVQRDLRLCLESLRNNPEVEREIIVVDNASSDGTLDMLREFPEVHLIANPDNRGFAAANNQALAVARGEWLFLLNPDTIVPQGALKTLMDFAQAHPEAGAVGPRLLNTDGSLQYSCRRFPTVRAALYRHTIFGRLFPRARAAQEYLMAECDHTSVQEVDWISGAAMLINRRAYDQIGGLDEGFYWGSEDVDYCFRLHHTGWKVFYTPEPAITHAIGRSTDRVIIPTIIRTHRSMQRLYTKYFTRNLAQRLLVTAGIWVRAALLIASVWVRLQFLKLKKKR